MKTIDPTTPKGFAFPRFIETKEYKRFEEFATACTTYQYIGVCQGEAGVGKSLAAAYYTGWNEQFRQEKIQDKISWDTKEKIAVCRGVLWVAPVNNTPKIINDHVKERIEIYGWTFCKAHGQTDIMTLVFQAAHQCPLLIIDEADRLCLNALEQLRYLYDQWQFGMILIGMPGIERKLSRYPQLYSRIGFSHEFRKLSEDEMHFIFERKWQEFGQPFSPDCFSDVEAINTIMRITAGNFRLIERLFSQIKRILEINKLEHITKEVVDAARDCLVIGHTT